jgi:hypothetical protein
MTLVDCETSLPLDISTAIGKVIVLRGPSTRLEKTASFVTDGTDGKVTTMIGTNEILPAGEWFIQAVITFPVGIVHSSEVKRFTVSNNI